MKKRRITDKLNIPLDLTSLLDVILIILMVVMCNRELNVSAINDVSEELADAKSTIELYETHEETLDGLDDKVAFVTLYADFDGSNPTVRHIKMMFDDDLAGFTPFDITASDEADKYEALADGISAFLEEHSFVPVWITINDDNILYRDWIRIGDMMRELSQKYPNLYIDDKLGVR